MSGQIEVNNTLAGANSESPRATRSQDNLPDSDVAAVNNQNQEVLLSKETNANPDYHEEQTEEIPRDDDREIGEEFDMFIEFWPGAMGGFSEMEAQLYEDIQGLS